jgi:hypothetical protein
MSAAVRPKRLRWTARAKPLNWGQRLEILEALGLVLEGVYAHLPLKRSLYGFDILRAIEQLRLQLHTMTDLQFPRALTTMLNRLRDAHTQYQGPWTRKEPIASLPFLVEAYGPAERPRFVVSKVDGRSFRDRHFKPGVEVEYWNGVAFRQALELHAENETGGRPDARQARALESMTFRSLDYAPPPEEEWVIVGYREENGTRREIRLYWEGFDPQRAAGAARSRATRRNRGINPGAEAVRRAKKYRFNPKKWRMDRRIKRMRAASLRDTYEDFLSSDTKVTRRSGDVGYLRIWSFDVDDDTEFLEAAIEHLRQLPQDGLIIDIRDNPGGFIYAAERMLQLFTPNPITPTKFALRATRLTAAMSRATFNQSDLGPWRESLTNCESTGEPYSSHIPITSYEQCNDVGQYYGGPVVLVTNANTYSSGDLFAAGFVDNRLGPVICIGEATGAGGANVWESADVRDALAQTSQRLPDLPPGVSFQVAIRRAVRGSLEAEGTLIEDAGVPGRPYALTYNDIFFESADLIEHCAEILRTLPSTQLSGRFRGKRLEVATQGLERLEFFVDDNPAAVHFELQGDGYQSVEVAARKYVRLAGYAQGVCLQKRRIDVPKQRGKGA